MGKTEKLVVLSVLSLVVVLFVWSLGGGDETQAAEGAPSYGATEETASSRMTREPAAEDGRMLSSKVESRGSSATPSTDVVELEERTTDADAGFALPGFDPAPSRDAGGPIPAVQNAPARGPVHMRPGWDLVSTVGLETTIVPDLLAYTVQDGDTWESIARDFYGKESKAALLRHNNEGLAEPTGTIVVPAKDELGALGEARLVEVLRGETLWAVAERTLGKGTRWREIYDANRDVVPNPDYLAPGTVLTIPAQ